MKNNYSPTKSIAIKLLVLLALTSGLLVSCVALPRISPLKSIPVKNLSFPNADYSSILWMSQELIALTSSETTDYVWRYAKVGDQGLHSITFPDDPNCGFRTDYYVYESLPDGRFQLWKMCRIGTSSLPTKTLTHLMAYELQTGKMEPLAGPLPLGSSQASWNPDETRGVVYLDSGFARTTLYWIWNGGFGPMDVLVTDQGKSWDLKNFFPDFLDSETAQTGNTGRAVWSPDGHTIAFFASADAIGKTGFDRFYVEYKLYMMDADQLEPQPMLDKIYFPFIVKWSPDSEYIAFIGQYGLSKQEGIWLYSLATNSVTNISKGKFKDILWSPEGKSLIAIQCDDNYYCSKIEEYDLSNIIIP